MHLPTFIVKVDIEHFFDPQRTANPKPHFWRHKTFVPVLMRCTFMFRCTGRAFFLHPAYLIYMTKGLSGLLIQVLTFCPDFRQYYQSLFCYLTWMMYLYPSQNVRSTEQTEWNVGASAFDFLLWNTSTCNEGEQRLQKNSGRQNIVGYSASETRDFVTKGKKIKL